MGYDPVQVGIMGGGGCGLGICNPSLTCCGSASWTSHDALHVFVSSFYFILPFSFYLTDSFTKG